MWQRLLTSVAGRVLIGYLIFKVCVVLRADSSALGAANDTDDLCSSEGLKKYLNGSSSKEEVQLAYEHCRSAFLDENKISASVKQTVDAWIGTDLSRAETNQIFLVYEVAMNAPKPANLGAQFERDCKQMEARFQRYRDTIEPLTNHIDINLNSLLTNGIDEIDDQERDLFNYVQYSLFCRSLLLDDNDLDLDHDYNFDDRDDQARDNENQRE